MVTLGIDFGEKKIGLAISFDGKISYQLSVISYQLPKEAVEKIRAVCQEYKVNKIVVGLPLDQNAKLGKQAKKAKKFGEILKKEFDIAVDYVNETLTSNQAAEKMIEAGIPKSKRKEKEDSFAAQIILEDYLNESFQNSSL